MLNDYVFSPLSIFCQLILNNKNSRLAKKYFGKVIPASRFSDIMKYFRKHTRFFWEEVIFPPNLQLDIF